MQQFLASWTITFYYCFHVPDRGEHARMSDCPDAALPAAPCNPSTDGRAARLAKFERERLIVDTLNRGVSVAEIAARGG